MKYKNVKLGQIVKLKPKLVTDSGCYFEESELELSANGTPLVVKYIAKGMDYVGADSYAGASAILPSKYFKLIQDIKS